MPLNHTLKRTIGVVIFALFFSTFAISTVAHGDDSKMRVAQLPDLGSFAYPVESYSLRPDASGIATERMTEVLFPGAFSFLPNDSFAYMQMDAGHMVYTVRVAAVVAPAGVTAATLGEQFGKLPLLTYDAAVLSGKTVQTLQIDGLSTVRVDEVAFTSGMTPAPVASHLLVLNGGVVIEIVILPTTLVGAPLHNEFATGDPATNRQLVEDIVASFKAVK
jgi:hypothetical protein